MLFGTNLRYFRKKQKISQQELGQLIDKPQTTISDWENGKYLPDIDDAVKIASALGVSVSELLGETQPKAVGE